MDSIKSQKIRELVFERLVSGEDREQIRGQLARQLPDEEAERLVAEAEDRIARGRGSATFAKMVSKIRKRRLVGSRYLIWRILAGFLIFMGLLSVLVSLLSDGMTTGSFGGLLIGGIILAVVEWREQVILRGPSDDLATDEPS